MHLSKALRDKYTREQLTAPEAQRLAQFIAWGPAVFEASRAMLRLGILDMLRDSDQGMTIAEVAERAGITPYAATVLLEASLSIGTVLVDADTDRFTLSKAGWFLITDRSTRANLDFNHDVNYIGWHRLQESLEEGRPAGLEHFGPWPTIYEGLSQLPEPARSSWFGFDHFYSDGAFGRALEIVMERHPRQLLDVGGNTGRWAMQCVAYDPDVQVTILDLPQQIGLMRAATAGQPGADRIDGVGINLLDPEAAFPPGEWDAIWMSQFLDCFSEAEIVSILRRAARAMSADTRLYIMETLWDRQRYEPAALCLTMTSLYFTALANGNSRMYHSDVMGRLAEEAGLEVEAIHDGLGLGHSVMVCKLKQTED